MDGSNAAGSGTGRGSRGEERGSCGAWGQESRGVAARVPGGGAAGGGRRGSYGDMIGRLKFVVAEPR